MDTAYHEAGHVAVYFALFRPIRKVTIVPTDEFEGCCYGYNRKLPRLDYCKITPKVRNQVEMEIMIYFAGGIASNRFTGKEDADGVGHDNQYLTDLAMYMASSEEEIDAYLKWLYIRTQNLIDQPGIWPFIEALASELMNKRTLSGKETKAIWNATLASIICNI
jgi:ATP-dependent Zn protease